MFFFFFQAEDGIRDLVRSRGLGDVYKRQEQSVLRLQGIQFSGEAFFLPKEMESKARKTYLQKFPIARLNPSELWYIRLDWIKMTDNTLGFGTKLIWERELAIHQAAS
mgnify:CR=1 FL=1